MDRRLDLPPPERPSPVTLRVSITDRCNLRCVYCRPSTDSESAPEKPLPTLERLAEIVRWIGRRSPLRVVRVTGGEPTTHCRLPDFLRMLASADEVPEIAMTTNGILLGRMATDFADAGLDRVNISIDTLDPDRYSELTRGGRVADVLQGVRAAVSAGLHPVRLNTVLRRSSWRKDVPTLLDFAREHGVEPRFLELMPTGADREWSRAEFVSASTVRGWLAERCGHRIRPSGGDRPSRDGLVFWRGQSMTVGWITSVSEPFCGGCSRLRLDAAGRLRRCLMDPSTLSLDELLTGGQESARIRMATYLEGKTEPDGVARSLPMADIGG